MSVDTPPPVRDGMTAAGWIAGRFLPLVLLAALTGLAVGFFRFRAGFIPGLQGMILGGLLGYLAGRIGRRDPEIYWAFNQRIWLSLSLALVCVSLQTFTVGALSAGDPLAWLGDVLSDSRREFFIGYKGRYTSFGNHIMTGHLSGFWWMLFTAVEFGLMAFLSLAFTIIGLSPDKGEGDGTETAEDVEERESARPVTRVGFACFALLVLIALAALGGTLAFSLITDSSLFEGVRLERLRAYNGEWRIEGMDDVLAGENRLTLYAVTDRILTGVIGRKRDYVVNLREEDGLPAGDLLTPSGKPVALRLEIAEGEQSLTIHYTVPGQGEKQARAARIAP